MGFEKIKDTVKAANAVSKLSKMAQSCQRWLKVVKDGSKYVFFQNILKALKKPLKALNRSQKLITASKERCWCSA